MMDPKVLNSDHAPSRSTILDVALQIGLVGFLIYACSRYISPFSDLLIWSAILAVMLYPLHLRMAARLGNRWSALLIGLVGVTVMLVAMGTVVTSIASSLYSLIVGLHNQSLTVPPPPPWLAELPLVGRKLAEAWVLVATNMPEAFAKYRETLSEPAGRAVQDGRSQRTHVVGPYEVTKRPWSAKLAIADGATIHRLPCSRGARPFPNETRAEVTHIVEPIEEHPRPEPEGLADEHAGFRNPAPHEHTPVRFGPDRDDSAICVADRRVLHSLRRSIMRGNRDPCEFSNRSTGD